MVDRLIEVKDAVNDLLTQQKADALLVSEWSRLGEQCELLEPFAVQTDKLQSNCNSLSYVIPALLELECHFLSCHAPKAITKAMLDDIQSANSAVNDYYQYQYIYNSIERLSTSGSQAGRATATKPRPCNFRSTGDQTDPKPH